MDPQRLTNWFGRLWKRSNARSESTDLTSAQGERGIATRDVVGSTIISGDVHIEAPPVALASLHQVPSPPTDFTGRTEELEDLLRHLDRGARIGGLQGLGGIGKTALAVKLAQMLASRYPDAQIYLDLKGTSRLPLNAAQALRHVIQSFLPTSKLPDEQSSLEALFRSVLHEKRVLLLMDNAASAEQVSPLLPPEGCCLLVTSRRKFALPGVILQDLGALKPESARELLLAITDRIGRHADEIARFCGYLPLALRLAGQAIAVRRDLSPVEYIRRLADGRERLRQLGEVEVSLELSYELLSSEAQKRLRQLAVFPGRFDEAAAAAVWEEKAHAARDQLGELFTYSLLEWEEASERYRLHDLVCDFADVRLGGAERDSAQRFQAIHYLGVLSRCDKLYLAGGASMIEGLALFDLERENIEVGQAWAVEQAKVDRQAAEVCLSYPHGGAFALSLRQHPRDSIRWLEAALRSARKLDNRAGEGSVLGNLGLAYADLGEYRRAMEHYEQQLAITIEIGDRRGHGNALGNLGNVYGSLGAAGRAIECYEQALAIDREIGDRRGEGADLGNLGNAYADLGESRRAIEHYEQALAIDREIGDRRAEGDALGGLGNAYVKLGETRRAIEYYKQRLAIAREIGDRRGEGNAFGNLGVAYAKLGEDRHAIEHYEQRLAIAHEIGDPRGEGISLFNLSLSLDALGDRVQAMARARDSLEIFEQIEDPAADAVRNTLADWSRR
jgi:tetratricopeptide (TPR) repeat protein